MLEAEAYKPLTLFIYTKLCRLSLSSKKTSDDGTRLELVKSDLGLSFLEIEEALFSCKKKTNLNNIALDFSTTLHFVIANKKANEPVISALMQEIIILWHIGL